MKTIRIHVPEDTYRAFHEEAPTKGQSASELIRAAMEAYYRNHISSGASVFDAQPADLGRVLRPLSADDDLLEEMLG
ncbi:MAG: ribbon-helix-helix protein, CopG family [Spirochaetia bacterium]